ncbi:hypothetical protein [Halegenticoccus soli]|uniref:hypothetical protein n=1 Tax=Halegenticoccus soli TaxID=1985678 RepID=UPI000C6CEE40|nr:hypothetical protein [Halegenticoccus soli]
MSADGSGPGRREVAYRLFAAEYDDATLSYSESDEERAPNYVVTPTGLRVNRLFAVGVLTEVESVSEDVLRGRVVDPTGAFVTYAGQYQPEAMAFLDRTSPPAFVALTGKARTFEPEDSNRVYTSVRPESLNAVDAGTRDRWVVSAAEATLRRVGVFAAALDADLRGDDLREALLDRGVPAPLAAGIPLAIEHYGTTTAYLEAVRRLAADALAVVAGERDGVRPLELAPDEGGEATLGPLPETAEFDLGSATADRDDDPTGAATESESAIESETEIGTGTETATEAAEAEATGEAEPAFDDEAAESEPTEVAAADAGAEVTAAAGTENEAATTDTEATTDADAASETEGTAKADATSEPSTESNGADPTPSSAEDDGLGDFDGGGSDLDSAEGLGDFDDGDLYELDEEERREVREEFGTEFSTGSEVGEPGEADIDVPGADELDGGAEAAESAEGGDAGESVTEAEPAIAGDEPGGEPLEADSESDGLDRTAAEPGSEPAEGESPSGSADAESESEPEATGSTATEPDPAAESAEPAADVDLEDAAVDAMEELDDGDGADREAVVAALVDRHGADPGAVEDAIQDALMSGKCYEPGEGRLKAI